MQKSDTTQYGIDSILRNAFFYWNKTLIYHVLLSLLYFCILFTVYMYASSYYEILDPMIAAVQNNVGDFQALSKSIADIKNSPNYQSFQMVLISTQVFLFPLQVGLYKMYRKIDLGEKPTIVDLFSAYNGINFFLFASFYFFWMCLYSIGMMMIIPGVIWVYVTVFVAPLMFFLNKSSFESIKLSFNAVRNNFVYVFVAITVAIIVKFAGFLVFFIGGAFTFSFATAVIYSLYKNLFKEIEKG